MREVAKITIVWAIFALIFGWVIYIVDPTWSMFYIPGIMLMLSGASAVITAVLVFLGRSHTIALISCVISAILGLSIVIGFYGFLVANAIAKAKDEFID